jgi:hypothetical protein
VILTSLSDQSALRYLLTVRLSPAAVRITITGTNFLPGATPILDDAQFGNVVIVDENTITADVTVPAATPDGLQDMLVALPGTGPGQLAGSVGNCVDCVTYLPPGC